ncbi:MAG: HIT family protein [Saprospiraceae bacterium]|nr:HIT family protein [Saprospiraceae bacterium]
MASLFTRIIQGEIPCYGLGESEHCFSFLDIRPLVKGHALVVPKREIDYLFDVPDDLLTEMMLFSKRMALAIREVVPCQRIGVSVIGLEVPHAHIHLVPLQRMDDLNFGNPRLSFTPEEYQKLAEAISAAFANIR